MNGTVLGIAGVGLIGGSIALRAHALGATVIGYDRDAAALRAATAARRDRRDGIRSCNARGALRRARDRAAGRRDDRAARGRAGTRSRAARIRRRLGQGAGVDAAALRQARGGLAHFVASHPLAGREVGGFGAADAAPVRRLRPGRRARRAIRQRKRGSSR